ncbi:D-TA family PLP-dependent enzyme [Acidisoma cellulosilytica]|uniref:D-TA family PLP-dependent enzyme n=1 Tax=Acidisoma cellulosilyticum TaxID=2802395 RepID=A0A963Z1J6_9PROT|nr:D-TA family PLP-dependent enzyme [Acidisoma cellulosilyticum]MCB8881014.1 D-TA family PLP-dependent enzyme [Acidisoma cellulosilyticum]
MSDLASLDTPVPVIDLDIVERNLVRMQNYANAHGIALRPHIKTHKLPAFAKRAVELGAVGITCQKLGEAEVMAAAGLDDILISYPLVGAAKARRLVALTALATMRVAIDNPVALATLAQAARDAKAPIGVLVEFDSGQKRTGVVSVAEALTLIAQVKETPGLRFDGLMTYRSTPATASFIQAVKDAGVDLPIVSGGGTPGWDHTHEVAGLTEMRVGTYIYNDRMMVEAGAATLDDCALHVFATVISRPEENRAVIDCGSKTLSSDPMPGGKIPGFGLILDYPDAIIERLTEEHGMVDLSQCEDKPKIGDRLQILPNHVCVVTNLHNDVVVSRGGLVEGVWPVAARGLTR